MWRKDGYFAYALLLYGAMHEHESLTISARPEYEINNLEDGRKTCTVKINGLQASGAGETDKDAKEIAARNMIRILDPSVAALEEYCAQTDLTRPVYHLDIYEEGLRKCPTRVDGMKVLGEAVTYKEAQGIGARKMLRLLQRGEDDALKLDGRDVFKELLKFVKSNVVPLFVLHYSERVYRVIGPRYEAFCKAGHRVKTIKHAYGDTILEARQRVALKMLRHLKEYKEKELEQEKEKEKEQEKEKEKEQEQEQENVNVNTETGQ